MTLVRALIIGLGAALIGYGLLQVASQSPTTVIQIMQWLAAAVILHDLIFAPLCAGLGVLGRQLIPRQWWAPAATAGLFTIVLILIAAPVFGRQGAVPGNTSILDRDYPRELLITLAIVWASVPVYYLLKRRR